MTASKASAALDLAATLQLTERDFAELAILCADQAGMSPADQLKLEHQLDNVIPPLECDTCHGSGETTAYVWINGEEQDDSGPCADCCDVPSAYRESDRKRDAFDDHCDRVFLERRDDALIGGVR